MCGLAGQQMEIEYDRDARIRNQERLNRVKQWFIDRGGKWKTHRLYPGRTGLIMTRDFGLIPATFAYTYKYNTKKGEPRSWYAFNTRCEGGKFINKNDDPDYAGPWNIFTNPVVEKFIYTQRCIIPVKFFVEGPTGSTNEKYLFEREDKCQFYLGGNYILETDPQTGLLNPSFTIYTLPQSPLTAAVGHHRSPLEIPEDLIEDWLNPELTREEIEDFFEIANGEGYQFYRAHDFMLKKTSIPDWEDSDDQWLEPQSETMKIA